LGYFIRYWESGVKRKNLPREEPKRNQPWNKRLKGVWLESNKQNEQNKELKRFQYNRVQTERIKELECIIGNARRIHWTVFIKRVEKEFIQGFERFIGRSLKEEQCAEFYKSVTLEGEEAFYFIHSRIEYIFY